MEFSLLWSSPGVSIRGKCESHSGTCDLGWVVADLVEVCRIFESCSREVKFG